MIEVLSTARCIDCDICIRVCPTNVFEPGQGAPVIARQSDCQTCFQCEAYCPVAAIYVAPFRIPVEADSFFKDEAALLESGQLGIYRSRVGWGDDPKPAVPTQAELATLTQSMRARLPGGAR
jgi:NAD-dependent dihydropyrimidine dehydrogenase PreA subunit